MFLGAATVIAPKVAILAASVVAAAATVAPLAVESLAAAASLESTSVQQISSSASTEAGATLAPCSTLSLFLISDQKKSKPTNNNAALNSVTTPCCSSTSSTVKDLSPASAIDRNCPAVPPKMDVPEASSAADARAAELLKKIYDMHSPNSVYIRADKKKSTLSKLAKIIQTKASRLHVISDFDMTLTRYWVDGKRGITSHAVIDQFSRLPESVRARAKQLFEFYYPIEKDATMPHDVKYQHMVDWWNEILGAFLDGRVRRCDIPEMIDETPFTYREGVKEAFEALFRRGTLLTIFSAGMSDIIEVALDMQGMLYPNIKVYGNKMKFENFDDTDVTTDSVSKKETCSKTSLMKCINITSPDRENSPKNFFLKYGKQQESSGFEEPGVCVAESSTNKGCSGELKGPRRVLDQERREPGGSGGGTSGLSPTLNGKHSEGAKDKIKSKFDSSNHHHDRKNRKNSSNDRRHCVVNNNCDSMVTTAPGSKAEAIDNLHTLADSYRRSQDKLVAFCDPLIHVLNKGELGHALVSEHRRSYMTKISAKSTCNHESNSAHLNLQAHANNGCVGHEDEKPEVLLLLGDGIGDSTMANGFDDAVVLRIGFCNMDAEKWADQFQEKFDIVLTMDPGFGILNEILATSDKIGAQLPPQSLLSPQLRKGPLVEATKNTVSTYSDACAGYDDQDACKTPVLLQNGSSSSSCCSPCASVGQENGFSPNGVHHERTSTVSHGKKGAAAPCHSDTHSSQLRDSKGSLNATAAAGGTAELGKSGGLKQCQAVAKGGICARSV